MKNRTLRILAVVMLLALAAGMVPAMAAKKVSIAAETLYAGDESYRVRFNDEEYFYSNFEIVSVTSNKPSVLKVENPQQTYVLPLKAGTATITIQYKDRKGKKYNVSGKITVIKYPNPIKSITVNGKSFKVKNYKTGCQYADQSNYNKKLDVKINLKPASGWSIAGIKASKGYDYDKSKAITVKNNKKFTLPKATGAVVIYTLKNKKGVKFAYTVRVIRAEDCY